jgi:DNA alkylation repair enzyme
VPIPADKASQIHPIMARSWVTRKSRPRTSAPAAAQIKNMVHGCFERSRKAFKASSSLTVYLSSMVLELYQRKERASRLSAGLYLRVHSSNPSAVAGQIRRALENGGSSDHAVGVQWFFKEKIKSHGWYTADLRISMLRCRKEILRKHDVDFLLKVTDELFSGKVLEEKIAAVFLLEKMDAQFGDREFKLFASWLDRISSWADHDALVHYLIAPMVAANPDRVKDVFRWANPGTGARPAWR